MSLSAKRVIKQVLGELPYTAELYWQLRQPGKPISKSFSLKAIEKWMPDWLEQAGHARESAPRGRKIFIFSTLRYWIEHAALTGIALAGLGHEVTLAYMPYANWQKPMPAFDLRRQNAYAQSVFQRASSVVKSVSLLDVSPPTHLPSELQEKIAAVSLRDVQYTLQVEDVDRESDLYRLRLERNTRAAGAALRWLQIDRPEVVVTPNGMILEMGAVFQVARYLGIPVVTYEFGEQRGRIWLATNVEVMRQDTNLLWQRRGDTPLTPEQLHRVQELFTSRQQGGLWENFSRRWQGAPSKGGLQARQALKLDDRRVVLLAANVIGDSLTLGRQVFSQSMTEWLLSTVRYFVEHPQSQLIVRIHPGERYTQGPSVGDILLEEFTHLPENVHLVGANDPINTYDLVEIADLGLVYTTTVGMEMAMSGVPVVVAGQTHYRGRGFTYDPASWEAYYACLGELLEQTEKQNLSQHQIDQAWNYAYRFYFEYPQSFPWHLLHFGSEQETWPMASVLSGEGQAAYGRTFAILAGEPLDWPLEMDSTPELSAEQAGAYASEASEPGQLAEWRGA